MNDFKNKNSNYLLKIEYLYGVIFYFFVFKNRFFSTFYAI